MNKFKRSVAFAAALIMMISVLVSCGQNKENGEDTDIIYNDDGTVTSKVKVNNPILAGYHADPSAYKFGDTYYIYSTTDGYVLNGNAGWPMIWKSTDFVNWEASPMELLTKNGRKYTKSESYFWAPSMLNYNNKYYLFFTQGDYFTMVAEGDSPEGPFTVLGNLFGTTDATFPENKTIDAQAFLDDDGKIYLAYLLRENATEGDKVLYTAICELDPNDLTNVLHIERIEELSHSYREGQEIFKRNGKYYMLYSEGSWTGSDYHVVYAMADSIYGPYTVMGTILESPGDGKILGTGHNSTIMDGDRCILVYHRQSIPFLGFGFRQVCADEMTFNEDGTINTIRASYEGITIDYTRSAEEFELKNVAAGATVTTEEKIESRYRPAYLTDENNATLWKSEDKKDNISLVIELDNVYDIKRTEIYFEYGSKYYRYTLETSLDNINWEMYADNSSEKTEGTPRKDVKEATAKYIRLTVTDCESLTRNYGSKANGDPDRWKEPQRVGIFEFKAYGKLNAELGTIENTGE